MANHILSCGRLAAVAGLLAFAFAGAVAAPAEGTPDAGAQRSYVYTALDFPGSSQTIFWGLDDLGRMAGQYAIAGGTAHAMTYRHGRFAPLAPDELGQGFSAAGGPTDAGTTFGGYTDAAGAQHGFVIRHGGRFETVDFAGHLNSNVDGMDVLGTLLGVYWDADLTYHGILRQDGGDTPFDYPGARDTYPLGLNSRGDSVGFWDIDPAVTHGWLRDAKGRMSTLDVPGATSTAAFAVNERGQVAGYYADAAGVFHGFVKVGETFRTLDMPGSVGTFVTALNNLGDVAGEYFDQNFARHGFTATLK